MKKVIFCCVAVIFSTQAAFANDLDDLDDVQAAIGSVVSSAISGAIRSSVGSSIASELTGSDENENENERKTTTARGPNGPVATGQYVALTNTQFDMLGDRVNDMTAECQNASGITTTAQNACPNGIKAILSRGEGGVGSVASTAAVIKLGDAGSYVIDE